MPWLLFRYFFYVLNILTKITYIFKTFIIFCLKGPGFFVYSTFIIIRRVIGKVSTSLFALFCFMASHKHDKGWRFSNLNENSWRPLHRAFCLHSGFTIFIYGNLQYSTMRISYLREIKTKYNTVVYSHVKPIYWLVTFCTTQQASASVCLWATVLSWSPASPVSIN